MFELEEFSPFASSPHPDPFSEIFLIGISKPD
jgi:hypothetical protein